MQRIDDYLEKAQPALNRQERGNIRFQLARAATAFALSSSRPKPAVLAKVNPAAFDAAHLDLVYEWVMEARVAAEHLRKTSDPNVLAKSAEWSREIDRRLSRYTDKTRWPKRLTAD